MSGWLNNLKNLQGQLTELASEVLNEATEEVADPESELQVIRRRCVELEDQLRAESTKSGVLEGKLHDAEEEAYGVRVELEAAAAKSTAIITARDEQIKKLLIALEKAEQGMQTEDFAWEIRDTELADLKREIAHWKNVVVNGADTNTVPAAEVEQRLAEQRRVHQEELARINESHEHKMKELVEGYEERVANHTGCATSESESSGELLDAVLLEKEELLEEKRKLEEELRRRKESAEEAVLVDVRERDEEKSGESTEQRLMVAEGELRLWREREQEFSDKEAEIERLRLQNNELAVAYNDLNNELEEFKQRHGNVSNSNRDLRVRIDALKANVIEYQERYETCKRENAETLKQLEKLSGDFERLRTGLAETKSRAEHSDASLAGEVDKLKEALDKSKLDRDMLRADVDRFRSSISSISEELEELRQANQRLMEENAVLSGQLNTYDGSMNDDLQRSSDDLQKFRGQFMELQKMQAVKEEQYASLTRDFEARADLQNQALAALREENEELKTKLKEASTDYKRSTLDSDEADAAEMELSGLTEQLREALAANTEMTEQCENLRREREELEKEITVRQSCIDEMIAQTSVLQQQQEQQAATQQALRQEILERDRRVVQLEDSLKEKEKAEKESSSMDDSSQIIARISQLEAENIQLREVATAKHEESLGYFSRLETSLAELAAIQQREAAMQMERDLERERNDKAQREVARLKEHLILVEETSTREAMEAEARETNLLTKVRALEEERAAASDCAAETSVSSQARISALEKSLTAAEREAAETRTKLAEERAEHAESSQALASLQAVVRELANEHEKESAHASHKALELQLRGEQERAELSRVAAELERITVDKQAAEDAAEASKQREQAKQAIIDDLEIRLGECSAAAASSVASSYRVDDATLRQLFLSYFTAPIDKRADIALLLASILEYPPEDMEKMRHAVLPAGFSHGSSGGPSLAQQFVRFLERESESSLTAMQLPVRTENARIVSDLPSQHTLPSVESTSALRDMLQEKKAPPSS